MESLNPQHVATVAEFLKGKRREKFLASVAVLNESIAKGEWSVPRGSIKADSGFYQGLYGQSKKRERHYNHDIDMCLSYGRPLTPARMAEFADKLTTVELAWARLCTHKYEVQKELDEARPKPVVTPIGLSPKVTKTLQECNLDIDLPTIKPAKLVPVDQIVLVTDREGNVVRNGDGTPKTMKVKVYVPEWTPGIRHHMSRFAASGGCEACGKHIPSRRFVPIEAVCRKNGLISMWLGCDCARNIFGIKDIGVEKMRSGV